MLCDSHYSLKTNTDLGFENLFLGWNSFVLSHILTNTTPGSHLSLRLTIPIHLFCSNTFVRVTLMKLRIKSAAVFGWFASTSKWHSHGQVWGASWTGSCPLSGLFKSTCVSSSSDPASSGWLHFFRQSSNLTSFGLLLLMKSPSLLVNSC